MTQNAALLKCALSFYLYDADILSWSITVSTPLSPLKLHLISAPDTLRSKPDPLPRDRYEHGKLAKRLRRQVGQAIADFGMIEAGDKIMVCVSGGKDSFALLDVLLQLQQKAPVPFCIVAVHLDQKHPGFPVARLSDYLHCRQIPFDIIVQDTYSVVKRVIPEGKTQCGLCSRLRRGALYAYAKANHITKIALGHHRDDLVETLFLNLFYHAKIAAMPPKLRSDDGQHIVIRPLAYVAQSDLVRYAEYRQFPVIPCNLCGSQDNLQRQHIRAMLHQWEKAYPGRIQNIARALGSVRGSQLADRRLFDFMQMRQNSVSDPLPDARAWLAGSASKTKASP